MKIYPKSLININIKLHFYLKGDVYMNLQKDRCPKCKSENIEITDIYDTEEDGTITKRDDIWDAHCNDCGWNFILVDII